MTTTEGSEPVSDMRKPWESEKPDYARAFAAPVRPTNESIERQRFLDRAALAALPELLSWRDHSCATTTGGRGVFTGLIESRDEEACAYDAYQIAEAMLAERDARRGKK